jgi:hypothetical protein
MKTRLLLPALALAAACTMQAKKSESDAPLAYKFPHGIHVEASVPCLECHTPVAASQSLKAGVIDVQIPKKSEVCSACHDPIPDYKPVMSFSPVVTFDHAAHLPRVNKDCQACHKKFTEPGDASAPVPAMAACTSCHQHAQDFGVGRCQPCHLDLKKYAYKPVAAYTHEANFLATHGKWARNSVQTCSSCHDQTMCAVCHTATTRPMPPSVQFPEKVAADFIHRGDWISRHAMEQQADPASCNRCHGPAYCQSCHAFQGVASGTAGGRDPHPANWITNHGVPARTNINACAACHTQNQGSTCLLCHSHGGVNPHPPGFKGTSAQKQSNPTCLVCHAAG